MAASVSSAAIPCSAASMDSPGAAARLRAAALAASPRMVTSAVTSVASMAAQNSTDANVAVSPKPTRR